ncbi:MAG: aspartate/glutamate racemase family protein [Pseudolabrys sp.]
MQVIGLIGGMSCESTTLYYQRLNDGVRARLGGLHSAEVLLWSVDFAPVAEMQSAGQWDRAGDLLADVARRLQAAGADMILLATNTMHRVAEIIENSITVPFIHIADATGQRIRAAGNKRPGLLATRFTMEQGFYVDRLRKRFGLDSVVPDEADRAETHRIIYDELCKGIVRAPSRHAYVDIAGRLAARGADCLILGCTEVGMLLNETNVSVPVFDTAQIHADAAVELALSQPMMAAE